MELITAHGGYKVDTRYITHTRRVEYACAVEQNRATWKDWAKVAGLYVLATSALTGIGLGLGYVLGNLL